MYRQCCYQYRIVQYGDEQYIHELSIQQRKYSAEYYVGYMIRAIKKELHRVAVHH